MAIPTSRTREAASIRINTEKCTGCGRCVEACSDNSLMIEKGKVVENKSPHFGCIGCGHCMAVCPEGAIEIHGRTLSPADLYDLPPKENCAKYTEVFSLLQRRRSIRKFQDKPVGPEIIQQILDAAATAPMGLPPSDVNVLVFETKEKNRAFAQDFCTYLDGMKWFVSDWFLTIMRPVWGKAINEMFWDFVKPLFKVYTEGMNEGKNLVNYDAPLATYFYGSEYCDPADPIIAATYAMIVAESLGLGTCMLGGIHPMIQNGKRARQFRKRHGIKGKSREGLFVIFGYPAISYSKGIKRTFASVN
jgi:ferredoxin/nitroreductase